MKEVGEKVVARFKPWPAGIHGTHEAVPSSGIGTVPSIDPDLLCLERADPGRKRLKQHLPQLRAWQRCGVATGRAERATAAPGPIAIHDGPVILNLSLPLCSLSLPHTRPCSSPVTSSIKTFRRLHLFTNP